LHGAPYYPCLLVWGSAGVEVGHRFLDSQEGHSPKGQVYVLASYGRQDPHPRFRIASAHGIGVGGWSFERNQDMLILFYVGKRWDTDRKPYDKVDCYQGETLRISGQKVTLVFYSLQLRPDVWVFGLASAWQALEPRANLA
jgi:hypothetical protein